MESDPLRTMTELQHREYFLLALCCAKLLTGIFLAEVHKNPVSWVASLIPFYNNSNKKKKKKCGLKSPSNVAKAKELVNDGGRL